MTGLGLLPNMVAAALRCVPAPSVGQTQRSKTSPAAAAQPGEKFGSFGFAHGPRILANPRRRLCPAHSPSPGARCQAHQAGQAGRRHTVTASLVMQLARRQGGALFRLNAGASPLRGRPTPARPPPGCKARGLAAR